MNMKALLGACLAFVLAVGGAAFLVASFAKPAAPVPAVPDPGVKLDYEPTNPFDLTTPGVKPKVVIAEPEFTFEVMRLGTEQNHDFVFKNEGAGPLRLAKGPMMCKCTIPMVPDQEVKPGESVKINLTWKPVETSKHFSKDAVIWTNDPIMPKITLSIHGPVLDDPVAYPAEFDLGDIPWNKEHESEVYLVSTTSTDLKFGDIEVSHPDWMSVTSTSANAAQLVDMKFPEPEPKSGYSLKLTIKPNGSVGLFSGWVKTKSNLKEEATSIAVKGMRTGPISIHSSDYHASLTLIDLKRFKSADGKSVKLFVSLESFGPELQILGVTSASKHLSATLQKVPTVSDAKKDRYILQVQAAKGVTPGTVFTSGNPDLLTLKTNHPDVPEIRFKAAYVVN